MMLKCDVCDIQLLVPSPKGIHQLRCPLDDFEYTYDNDLRKPIEKIYYGVRGKCVYSLEADLLQKTVKLLLLEDKANPIFEDVEIGELPYDPEEKLNFEYFKKVIMRFQKLKIMK